jgi:protein TonB
MLIAPASYKKTTELEIGDFTSVRDMKAPNVTKQPKKKIPPKQEQVKQPPAAPQLDVTKSFDRNDIKLTQGMSKADIKNLDNIMVPILNPKDDDFELGQELTNTLSVQPMYPHKQMINKTEGWVKVQFTVNEYGNVINASVVDAKPARVFNSSALKAIKKSKFKPLIIDGKAVAQSATQVYEFKMENQNK